MSMSTRPMIKKNINTLIHNILSVRYDIFQTIKWKCSQPKYEPTVSSQGL